MTNPAELRDVAQAGKDRDPAWYRVHRRLSIHITSALLRTSVKLDHITYAMMLLALVAAVLLALSSLWLNALGVLAGYGSFLLDKVDGEIARVRRQQAVRGILLDRIHHRFVEPLVFLALGVRAWQATDSVIPVIAALATMLAANIIEEMQMLPPFIAMKHARETRSWPVSARKPSPMVERLAGVMRSLKTFRMYLTVLPLVMLALLAEAWTGRSVTTGYLVVSAAALWAYALFQAWYYLNGRLDADIASLERQLPALPEVDESAAESPAAAPVAGAQHAARAQRVPTRDAAAIAVLLLSLAAGPAMAATYYVDRAHPNASTSGPGTETQPYSTISSAVAARTAAGNTILVKPGNYPETVTIPGSGSSGQAFVLRATGAGVIVDGADNFSTSAQWTSVGSGVYLAAGVTWAPKQVVVDDARLTVTTAATSSMPANSFRYVQGTGLYVDLDGVNPGTRQTFVGRRANSFVLSSRTWVVIDGFQALRAEDRSINLSSCSDVEILNNRVRWAGKYGVQLSGCTRVRVAGNHSFDNAYHGFMITGSSSNCTIEDNEGYRNILPEQRAANGIYMYGASNNILRRNKWYDNQDTGQHLQSGSNNNICSNNISWNNGDHGYDHLGATGTIHVNDVSFGNYKDGFSIEGTSTGTKLNNCIAVDNGLTTSSSNLWVDAASTSGFVSNDNIFWNSTPAAPIRIGSATYTTIGSYISATGQDTRSLQADPRFVSPATGDFRLMAGSPAIDNGNSGVANWPSTDRNGTSRIDAPGVANTGQGPVAFSDRGAHEYQPTGQPPVAALSATPSSGPAPLTVQFSAAGSSDPDGTITSYRFDFGDGTSQGPQAGATASHVYAAGSFTASVTVTDNTGLTNTKTVAITVTAGTDRAPDVVSPASVSIAEGALLTVNVTASDPDGNPITSLSAVLTGLPSGHNAVFTPGPDNTTGTLTWTPSFTSNGNYTVRFIAANTKADTSTTTITVSNTNRAPVVVAPANVTATVGQQLTVTVTASDPDGSNIQSLTANMTGLPSGHNATFSTNSNRTTGTFRWTPTSAMTGTFPVIFTASNSLTGRDTTQILVVPAGNQPPVARVTATPTSGEAPLTVSLDGSTSTDPESGALTYRFDFGDGTSQGPQPGATASHVYAAGNWTALLTTTDGAGQSDTATVVISVTAPTGMGPNLVGNPSFETDLAGWNQYSGASLLRVAGGKDGNWAVQVTSTNTTTSSFGINDSPNWVAVAGAAGSRYRFSAWVRSASSTGSAKLQVREYQGSLKVGVSTYAAPLPLTTQWQLITVEHTTVAAGTTLDFQVYESPVALGEVFLVDDVSIRLVSSPTQGTVATNESESRVGFEPTLAFSHRMVPSVMQTSSMLQFTTTMRGPVQIELFDAAGRRVRTLVDEQDMAPGVHSRQFDGRSDHGERLESGVYFYRVRAAERSAVGRVVLAR